MFREIRVKEIRNEKKEEGFRKIKPETDMTVKEATAAVNAIWMEMIREAQEG